MRLLICITIGACFAFAAAGGPAFGAEEGHPVVGPDYQLHPPADAASCLADARAYYSEGSCAWALAAAEELARRWPDNPARAEGDYIRLRCLLRRDMATEADAAFDDYFKRHKSSRWAVSVADLLVDVYADYDMVYGRYQWRRYLEDEYGYEFGWPSEGRHRLDRRRREVLGQVKAVYERRMSRAGVGERKRLADRLVANYLTMYRYIDWEGREEYSRRGYRGRADYLRDVAQLEMSSDMRSVVAATQALLELGHYVPDDKGWKAVEGRAEDYESWVAKRRFERGKPALERVAAAYPEAPGGLVARAALAHYDVTFRDEPGEAAAAFEELAALVDDEGYAAVNRLYARHLRAPASALVGVRSEVGGSPALTLDLACRGVAEVEIALYAVDPTKFPEIKKRMAALEGEGAENAAEDEPEEETGERQPVPTADLPGVGEVVARWVVPTGCQADDYRVKKVLATRDELAPGLYVAEARVGGDISRTLFMHSGAAAVVHTGGEDLYVEVVDRNTGAPTSIRDLAAYYIYERRRDEKWYRDVGERMGVAAAPCGPGLLVDLKDYGRHRDILFVLESSLGPAIYAGDTGYNWRTKHLTVGEVITDRPLYRPGDEVSYKGILREVDCDAKKMRPLVGTKVNFYFRSPREDERTWVGRAETDEFGTASGSFVLPPGIGLGLFTLVLEWPGKGTEYTGIGWFAVEEYEKPEYELKVTPSRERYLSGERAEVDVAGSYYFGAPMSGAPVSYEVLRSGASPDGWDYSKLIRQGRGALDGRGHFKFAFYTPWAREYDSGLAFKVGVKDASGRLVEEWAGVRTYRTDRYVEIKTEKYTYRPGEVPEVFLRTSDWDRPVSADVTLTVYRQEYSGFAGYRRREAVFRRRLRTDAQGRAKVEMEIEEPPERLEIVAVTRGSNGGRDEDSTYIEFAEEEEATAPLADVWFKVDPRKPKTGDDVEVLVESSLGSAECTVTIYAGRLVDVRHVKLEDAAFGSRGTFSLKIGDALAAGFELRAKVVKDGWSWDAERRVGVDNLNVKMDVAVESAREEYRPAEEASVTVMCRDLEGMPVAADLSLVAVDSSLLALSEDKTREVPEGFAYEIRRCAEGYFRVNDSLRESKYIEAAVFWFPYYPHFGSPRASAFVPARYTDWGLAGRTANRLTFPRLIKPALERWADIADVDLLRHDQRWYELVDSIGAAAPSSITGAAASEGLGEPHSPQAKPDDTTERAEHYFDANTGEQPEDLTSFLSPEDRRRGFVVPRLRRNFLDAAAWLPNVRTDEAGVASVSFELPDNLTEWQVMALACDQGQRFGWGSTAFDVNKYVIARLKAPRYLVAGDRCRLTAIGHNYLDEAKEMKLAVTAEGLAAAGGEASRTGKVAPGDEVVLYRWVKADDAGEGRLVTLALTDVESDAAELKVPVYPCGAKIRQAYAGRLRDEATHKLEVVEGVEPASFKAELYATPSLAATLSHGLDYFRDYPYNCVEQTLNRFRLNALLAAAAEDLGLERTKLVAGLPAAVDEGIARLAEHQTQEGGWPWWRGGRPSPYVTAYAVDGLRALRGSPFLSATAQRQRQRMVHKGGLYVSRYVGEWITEPDRYPPALSLYVTDVALRTGAVAPEYVVVGELADYYFEERSPEDPMALALLASVLRQLGDEERLAVVMRNLDDTARVDDVDTMHWGRAPEECWRWWDDAVETTAKVLEVKLACQPDSPHIPYLVNWLVDQRRGAAWKSTKDSAAATLALMNYIKANPGLAAPIVATYWMGKAEGALALDPRAYEDPGEKVTFAFDDFAAGENDVRLSRAGGRGPVFYTAAVEYYAEGRDLPASQGSVTLERAYYVVDKKFRRGRLEEKLEPLGRPLKMGEEVEVVLTINSPYDFDYVVLEDPKAAGCVDLQARSHYDWALEAFVELWNKQRVVFFEWLPQGETVVRYRLRAEVPGTYTALPARVYGMYSPDIGSSTASAVVEVTE